MYITDSIDRYLKELAAKQPSPGGGSAAGVSGALGVALLEMVCNFTVGKEKYRECEAVIKKHLSELTEIRKEFSALIDEDVAVYTQIQCAFKSKDKKSIDKGLKDGYYISLKACKLSNKAIQIALELSQKGNLNLITDVGCGVELLMATFNSGVFNAKINLKSIEDKLFIEKESATLDGLKQEIEALYKQVISKTKERMS